MSEHETDAPCPYCVSAGRNGMVVVTLSTQRNYDRPLVYRPGSKNAFTLCIAQIGCNSPDCCAIFSAVPGRPGLAEEILNRVSKQRQKPRTSVFLNNLAEELANDLASGPPFRDIEQSQ